MDHAVCINQKSFPGADRDQANELFHDSIQGLLNLNGGNDRYILYLDSNQRALDDFELAVDFSYSNFKDGLRNSGEIDLFSFLSEIEDKSPALDHVSEEILNEMADYIFFMPGCGAEQEDDVFGLAWYLSAILLSIRTHERWNSIRLSISRTENGQYIDEELWLDNISCARHGLELKAERNSLDFTQLCVEHELTENFEKWVSELSVENKQRVYAKLKLSCERNFQGGKPLFDTLENANGLREIRLSAYPGGAIRILFKSLGGVRQAILVGFIKKDDNECYVENIAKANELYNLIT